MTADGIHKMILQAPQSEGQSTACFHNLVRQHYNNHAKVKGG